MVGTIAMLTKIYASDVVFGTKNCWSNFTYIGPVHDLIIIHEDSVSETLPAESVLS